MPRKKKSEEQMQKKRPPAKTPEAREQQLIALAVDQAEKQLMDGTASSQVITHFLKLGSTTQKLEQAILEQQKKHLVAKTEAIESSKRIEELYMNALQAMQRYSGREDEGYKDEVD